MSADGAARLERALAALVEVSALRIAAVQARRLRLYEVQPRPDELPDQPSHQTLRTAGSQSMFRRLLSHYQQS